MVLWKLYKFEIKSHLNLFKTDTELETGMNCVNPFRSLFKLNASCFNPNMTLLKLYLKHWKARNVLKSFFFVDWMFVFCSHVHWARSWDSSSTTTRVSSSKRSWRFSQFSSIPTCDPSNSFAADWTSSIKVATSMQHCSVLLSLIQVKLSQSRKKSHRKHDFNGSINSFNNSP